MLNKFAKLKDKEYIKNIRKIDSVLVDGDFVKKYTAKTKLLKIYSKNKSIEIELLSPYNQKLGVGKETLIAELKLKDWNNKNNLFDELEFFDRENFKKKNKRFIFKYCEEKTITMKLPADFPTQAKDNKMFEKVVGDWDNATEFTKLDELPHKNIRIGIFTETILGEKMEWLPTIDGFNIHEWAAYDITQLKSLEHDTDQGNYNSLVMIDSTHFILAYTGKDNDGFIKTFSIDGSYDITEIDSLEHDTSNANGYNSLVMINTTHFILAHKGNGDDGYIKTFSIDGSYDNITQIDSLEHDTILNNYNSLAMINTTHFMLAYFGSGGDGYIKTFSIDGSYDNITQIDVLEHDTVQGEHNSLVIIDSTHAILAYSGSGADGFIKTFSIDGSYDNITQIDSLEHDTLSNVYNSLVMIDSTHFILAYTGSSDYGYIKTFSIDGSYDITQVDSLTHNTAYTGYNSLVKIDSTHFMLAYSGSGADGFIKTFSIDGSYNNITEIDVLEHDTVEGVYNSLVIIDSTHAILAYRGSGSDGYIKTFSIEPSVSIPTVTTQAATSIQQTTCTGNGNITATGGANATRRGFCYMTGTSGDPTTANSVAYDDGDYGTGAYTKGITGLTAGTGYRVRAYAVNSAGTGYGTTVQVTTANAFTKNLSETINLNDNISNGVEKLLSDNPSLSDAIKNAPVKILSDNPAITDSIQNNSAKYLIDNPSISDNFNAYSVYIRNLSDNISLADALVKTVNINIAEILNITDGGLIISTKKNLADNLSLDDLISPLLILNKIIQNNINLADDIKKDNAKNLTETINLSDILSSISTYLKSISNIITIDDLSIKTINKNLINSITLSDQLGGDKTKSLLDSLSISDEKIIGIYKNLSENPTISDDIKKTIDKNLSENLTLSDDIQVIKSIYHEIINVVSISDLLYNSINKNIADALLIIDTLQKQTGKNLEDNFLVIESVDKNIGKRISDTTDLSDDIKFDTKISIQDSISIAEILVKGYDKTLIEALSIADSLEKSIEQRLYKKTIILNDRRDKILLISNNRKDKIILNSNPQ